MRAVPDEKMRAEIRARVVEDLRKLATHDGADDEAQ